MLPLALWLGALVVPPVQEIAPTEPAREEPAAPRRGLHRLELAVGSDASWLGWRVPTAVGEGDFVTELMLNEDDDVLATCRLMRLGRPAGGRLTVGGGLAAYAAFLDRPDDTVLALALAGSVRYDLGTAWPTSLGAEVAFAPDASTFDDGERLLDVQVRASVELSALATAYVGYRRVEADLEAGGDHELDEGVQVGVRISF
jgi:hypothetical protein